jgi:response regulator of citrate/malate metabolism
MAGPPIDRVVALGAKITELRRQLAACESELASLLRTRVGKVAARTTKSEGRRGTTAKIVRLLSSQPRAVFDAAEVAQHLGANIASVRVMLKRLVEAKKIRRTGRGAYRAR